MPLDLQRVKELTTDYYGNAPLQTGNKQQDQQEQDKQKIIEPQPGQESKKKQPDNAKDKQSDIQEAQKHPILKNALRLPENAVINNPTEQDITAVYTQLGITLKDKERRNILSSGRRHFDMQGELVEKAMHQNQRPARRINLRPADAIKLSDASLIAHFGEYTGQETYLRLRYNLLTNRYYAVLPKEETVGLSRRELIERLSKLYAAEPESRNAELISFFQDIIRIKDFEESVKKKPQPAQVLLADAITEDERSENLKFLERNEKAINESNVKDLEKFKRRALMRKIMDPGDGPEAEFLTESSIQVSPQQKEGIRQVLAWMYRNSCKTSISKIPFIHKLATSSPEKILLAMYLVEKGKQDAPSGDEFYEATHGYIPNLCAFKDKVIASKFKFWRRLGPDAHDNVINWSIIGTAVRYATASGGPENPSDVENFEKYNGGIVKTKALLEKDAPDSEAKREHLLQLLSQKGSLILTYYRSAGLSADMPIDMLPNKRMQEETKALLSEISKDIKELADLSKNLPDVQYKNVGQAKEAPEESDSPSKIIEGLETIMDPLNVGVAGDIGVAITTTFSSSVSKYMESTDYSLLTSEMRGVSGIIGFILSIHNLYELKSSPVLLGKGRLAQGLQSVGDLGFSTGVIAQAGTDFIGKYINIGSAPVQETSWYGTLKPIPIKESFSSVPGAVQFSVGSVTAATGILMTTAGAIQLRRTGRMKHSANKSREALDKKRKNLSENDKQLRMFLSHEKRVLETRKSSAIVQTFSGVLTLISGSITATGVLTPLGGVLGIVGIGTNLIYGLYNSWHKKKLNMKKTVDEALGITTNMVKQLKDDKPGYERKSDEEVRDMLRQEALGQIGFATYKECFAHLMKQYARLLFDQVMNHEDSPDWGMYYDALETLGMKIDVAGKIPPLSAIYSKLMK